MEKLIYQMFICGTGDELEQALEKGLGGIIYFTRDIESKKQFCDLIRKHSLTAVIPPFLSIDQEGGRVERTENIHNGKKYLSAKYIAQKGCDAIKKQTEEISEELLDYGFNMNFAPVLDVNTNINTRYYTVRLDYLTEFPMNRPVTLERQSAKSFSSLVLFREIW